MNVETEIYDKLDKIINIIDEYINRLDRIENHVKTLHNNISSNTYHAIEITYVDAELLIHCDL